MKEKNISEFIVSILIPVYNRDNFLDGCVKSALRQTYKNIEIIIVDNASTDKTWEICKKWAVLDPRVKIYRNEKNLGPVRNWKKCAELASGRYSKILFSDDLLEVDCIDLMFKAIHNDESTAFVYSSVWVGSTNTDIKKNYNYFNYDRKLLASRYLKLVLNAVAPVSPGAVMIRTEDLIKNLRFDFDTCGTHSFEKHGAGSDVMVLLNTAKAYKFIKFINKPLCFFRVHQNSFTISNEGDEIQKAYRAIFCYYLKKNYLYFEWFDLVTWLWIKNILRTKSVKNLRDFLLKHEGDGNLLEILFVILLIPFAIITKLLKLFFVKYFSSI